MPPKFHYEYITTLWFYPIQNPIRKTHENNHMLIDCCVLFILWQSSSPWIVGIVCLCENHADQSCWLINATVWVSLLQSLLLVALVIRHRIICCNFHCGQTGKSSSWTSSWSNILSSIMIIIAINHAIVQAIFVTIEHPIIDCGHHCDQSCNRSLWS